jgi:hypothetical protein
VRVLYIAKHGQVFTNDDEGAIQYALEQLGHEVTAIREIKAKNAFRHARESKHDFVLFHHWDDLETLKELRGLGIPRVFWFFDLVNQNDPTLEPRNARRKGWMERTIPEVDLGFCTDGDWVFRWNNFGPEDQRDKLVRLNQGADIRMAGLGLAPVNSPIIPLLFTGTHKGGTQRESFIREMMETYGSMFRWVEKNTYARRLADVIAQTHIVLAPDSPVTNLYWSNRVYNTLAFGGFLLHPLAHCLIEQYQDGRELVYYRSREDLHDKIRYYLANPEVRKRVSQAAVARTVKEHTYTNRVAEMVRTLRQRRLIDDQ